ncbi:MAG: ABC transporter permease, partial [Chloroflexi bacterium]
WGLMIQENYIALTVQPWGVILPVAAIALLTISTGLIGDGIARASAGIDRTRGAG